jgi:hypothetical protein
MAQSSLRQAWEFAVNEAGRGDEPDEEPIWKPLPGPQTMAYESEADETFYGGAAGGGKSDLILGLSLTRHQNSIIFRREYPQLKGLRDRCKKILKGTAAHYNSTEKTWSGLPDGRALEFGACQYEDDVEKYQGRPHDLKAADEITHFSKAQFKFLTGWLRTDDPDQRCRVVCTGNPPTTAEGQWVTEYWAPWLDPKHPNPAVPGELRWFAVLDGEDVEVESGAPFEFTDKDGGVELITPRSRTFIPASVDDNPYYAKTGYKSVLQSLPEPLRSQMLKGDFAAGVEDDLWQVIPTAWVEAAQKRWMNEKPSAQSSIGVDPARGGKDKTAIALRYGDWYELHTYPGKETPDGPTVAGLVMGLVEGNPDINVDVIGVGGAVVDSLHQMDFAATSLNGAIPSKATDRTGKMGFINQRAEWWWGMREALDPAFGSTLALPPDPELKADLCAPRWHLRQWKIQVEEKEEIKKRIGRSPDKGEAVIYASQVSSFDDMDFQRLGNRTSQGASWR